MHRSDEVTSYEPVRMAFWCQHREPMQSTLHGWRATEQPGLPR